MTNLVILIYKLILKIHNYDTNKLQVLLLIIDWTSREKFFKSGVNTKLLANIKILTMKQRMLSHQRKWDQRTLWCSGLLSELKLSKEYDASRHFLPQKCFCCSW